MPKLRTALIALIALAAFGPAGCLPTLRGRTRAPHPAPAPTAPLPAASPLEAAALAVGPPLMLDNEPLLGEEAVLEKLQQAVTDLQATRNALEEQKARAAAAEQRAVALEAELGTLRAQLTQVTGELKATAAAAAKTKDQLAAAEAAVAGLTPKLAAAEKRAAEADALSESIQQLTAEAEKLRDQALKAELAHVKARQDLIALQIVLARQQALAKRIHRPVEASAPPLPPPSPAKETAP